MIFGLPWQYFLLAVVVGVGAIARLTRLVTSDQWPPMLWAKSKWDSWTDRTDKRRAWWILWSCPFCCSPWIAVPIGGWLAVDIWLDGQIDWPWWVFCGWLTVAYAASIIVYHDEGDTDEE